MNASTTPQLSAITEPAFLTAGAGDATIKISLFKPTANTITVTLPIGNGAPHLIATGKAAQIGETELTDDSGWTLSHPQPTTDTYTCTLTGTTTPEFLLLTLRHVPVNNTPGTVTIKATGGIEGECTVLKYPDQFTLENFTAYPTTIKNGGDVNLSWNASKAKSLNLKYGTRQETVTGAKRTITGIHEPTTFLLEAATEGDLTAALTTNVQVTEPDLTFHNLTTKKLILTKKPVTTTRTRYLDAPLTLTAPADGYFTVKLSAYTRLLGYFPPVLDKTNSKLLHTIKLSDTHGASSFVTQPNPDHPTTFFTPAGTALTITPNKAIDFFTTLTSATVTWTGSNPESALPFSHDTREIHTAHPRYKELPISKYCAQYDNSLEDVTFTADTDPVRPTRVATHLGVNHDFGVTVAAGLRQNRRVEIVAFRKNVNQVRVITKYSNPSSDIVDYYTDDVDIQGESCKLMAELANFWGGMDIRNSSLNPPWWAPSVQDFNPTAVGADFKLTTPQPPTLTPPKNIKTSYRWAIRGAGGAIKGRDVQSTVYDKIDYTFPDAKPGESFTFRGNTGVAGHWRVKELRSPREEDPHSQVDNLSEADWMKQAIRTGPPTLVSKVGSYPLAVDDARIYVSGSGRNFDWAGGEKISGWDNDPPLEISKDGFWVRGEKVI
ncbi:hypothetical protein ABZ611_30875 [Streptomyces sp. NPDC007861]|uniref:hypothetical protein n=1 Tax=Streptomyces sp. NPDC007861 TaxID=3154893 RepID=UPI0033E04FF1